MYSLCNDEHFFKCAKYETGVQEFRFCSCPAALTWLEAGGTGGGCTCGVYLRAGHKRRSWTGWSVSVMMTSALFTQQVEEGGSASVIAVLCRVLLCLGYCQVTKPHCDATSQSGSSSDFQFPSRSPTDVLTELTRVSVALRWRSLRRTPSNFNLLRLPADGNTGGKHPATGGAAQIRHKQGCHCSGEGWAVANTPNYCHTYTWQFINELILSNVRHWFGSC